MPGIYCPNFFSFEEGQELPSLSEARYTPRDIDERLYHIETSDLETGRTDLIAVDLETPRDAAILFGAAIRCARDSDPSGMFNMHGYAIVGPNLEGRGTARDNHGIGFYLRCGHDIPSRILPSLLRAPEAVPELAELFAASAEVRAERDAADRAEAERRRARDAVA